jgi:Flp pilus assembly protein TadD
MKTPFGMTAAVTAGAFAASLAGCATPTGDYALLESGYNHIAAENWSDAETDLRQVLEADPDNRYAQLNMGVVYEKTGRPDEARAMYNQVIESGTTQVAARSTVEAEKGRMLKDIAEENLRGM